MIVDSSECIEKIQTRCSVRAFRDGPVPSEDLQTILQTGTRAPSAGNRQPWRIVVVHDTATKGRLAEAALGQKFVAEAPVVLVVCAVPAESARRYGERGASLYVLQDTAALTENILLAAHILGHGACWVGAFDDDAVARIIKAPEGIRPVAIIPLGRPKGEGPALRDRRPMAEVVVEESF